MTITPVVVKFTMGVVVLGACVSNMVCYFQSRMNDALREWSQWVLWVESLSWLLY